MSSTKRARRDATNISTSARKRRNAQLLAMTIVSCIGTAIYCAATGFGIGVALQFGVIATVIGVAATPYADVNV